MNVNYDDMFDSHKIPVRSLDIYDIYEILTNKKPQPLKFYDSPCHRG